MYAGLAFTFNFFVSKEAFMKTFEYASVLYKKNG